MWHRYRSTLAQVMACCLTAPSHCRNQCSLNITEALWHWPDGNFRWNAEFICSWYEFENYWFEIMATSLRGQWVNWIPNISDSNLASKAGSFSCSMSEVSLVASHWQAHDRTSRILKLEGSLRDIWLDLYGRSWCTCLFIVSSPYEWIDNVVW